MTQNIIEQELSETRPAVLGIQELWANISSIDWLVTVLIIVLAFGITRYWRHWSKARDLNQNTPNWLNVDTLSRVLFPLLLWLFAHIAKLVYEYAAQSVIWLEFLTILFGAFFTVRVFLHMVRRAMPDAGSVRRVIERGTVIIIWLAMLLDYIGVLDQWLSKLDSLKLSLGKNTISALDVLALFLVILIVYLVINWLAYEIEMLLLERPNKYLMQIDLSSRVILTRIIKGLLVVVGVLFSLTASGIDLTVLSVFGGALGVGIGLGLQKIASNYVSGFVVLFERSVRIGDLITTSDGSRGNVTQINARYTVIKGTDGNEIMIPNETLVTQPVVNWSLNDSKVWLEISIQVKHNTDIDFILPFLLDAVKSVERVLDNPEPSAYLSKITDKGVILDFSWWICDPENGRANISSNVSLAIWRVCRQHDVEFFV